MARKVVQFQPRNRIKETGQWTTGLCECYKDIGDCDECSRCMSVPASAGLYKLCTSSFSRHEGFGQGAIRHTGECVERLPVWMLLLSAILAPNFQRAKEKSGIPHYFLCQICSLKLPAGGALATPDYLREFSRDTICPAERAVQFFSPDEVKEQ
ncbi:unnamed protein product [Menidia menidia]|uniref:(Atlantic silverside) hypothetical protein n=1 Tax=Menidia menidia TaxID=238744 RepID=A0A8S4B4Q9_9TELE|nr:unnamed protein product [Menidia menidia]